MTYPFDSNQFVYRVTVDAINTASPSYWRRRAQAFRDAIPRATDFHGNATADDLRRRATRCRAIAEACEHHASLCKLTSEEEQIILDLIDTSSTVRDAQLAHDERRRAA